MDSRLKLGSCGARTCLDCGLSCICRGVLLLKTPSYDISGETFQTLSQEEDNEDAILAKKKSMSQWTMAAEPIGFCKLWC